MLHLRKRNNFFNTKRIIIKYLIIKAQVMAEVEQREVPPYPPQDTADSQLPNEGEVFYVQCNILKCSLHIIMYFPLKEHSWFFVFKIEIKLLISNYTTIVLLKNVADREHGITSCCLFKMVYT